MQAVVCNLAKRATRLTFATIVIVGMIWPTIKWIWKEPLTLAHATVAPSVAAKDEAKEAMRAEVRLNQLFYKLGDTITATVTVSDQQLIIKEGLLLAVSAPESKDVEILPLKPTADPTLWVTGDALPCDGSSGSARARDGKLTARPNEIFAAFFTYNDGKKPGVTADFGIMADKSAGQAVRLIPELAMTDDEKNVPPGGKRIGTIAIEHGLAAQLPVDELMFHPINERQLKQFLADTNGKIVATDDQPGASKELKNWYLVKVNPDLGRSELLPQMRALFDEKATLLASSPEVLQICALALQMRMEGYVVGVNPRLQFMGAPSIRDGNASDGAPMDAMSSDPARATNIFADDLFGVRRAWAFTALWDKDTQNIPVAFLDIGFAPNRDFRGYPRGIFERNVADGTSGPGAATGPPTVGASFFGPRVWHGNGVVTTAAGVLNNGYGAAGTGGQVISPMLYKMDLLSYAFEMGNTIRLAVNDGAAIVNISAGYPCRVISIFGADEVCSTGGRAGFCAKIGAELFKAANLICAAVGWEPVFGAAICATAVSGAATAVAILTPACFALLIAGEIRGPLQGGVDFALSQGRSVISVAGNTVNSDSVGPLCAFIACGNHDVSEWQIVPGGLPGVICVGVADSISPYPNMQFFGDRVDIWAPLGANYFHPPTPDLVVPSESQGLSAVVFGGTSVAAPYITGIIAMMAAVNPSLNPLNPALTPEQRAAIPRRVRDLLVNNATRPGDALPIEPTGRRRNMVNAFAAVNAAAAGAIPDFAAFGYDNRLGFDETAGTSTTNNDTLAGATLVRRSGESQFNGTILSLPSSNSGVTFSDTDWYVWEEDAAPGLYTGGVVYLVVPRRERFGDLRVNGQTGTLELDSDMLQVWRYDMPDHFGGVRLPYEVRGRTAADDSVYTLVFVPPTRRDSWEGDRFDANGANNDAMARAVPIGTGALSWGAEYVELYRWVSEINVADLSLHRSDDADWFSLTRLTDYLTPSRKRLMPYSCRERGCDPVLVILVHSLTSRPPIEVYDGDGRMLVSVEVADGRFVVRCSDLRLPLRIKVSARSTTGPVPYSLQLKLRRPTPEGQAICDRCGTIGECLEGRR